MKKLFISTLCILAFACLQAQNFAGTYTGEFNGDGVNLQLQSAGGKSWTGKMTDSQQDYQVSATAQGSQLTGKAVCADMGITFDISGQLTGNTLDLKLTFLGNEMPLIFTKNPVNTQDATLASANTAMPKMPVGAVQDKAVAGVWMRQENYNSGGSGGYFSSNSYLAFYADGTMSDLGGDTMIGTNDGSGFSGGQGKGVMPGVKWYTEKNNLYLVATDGHKTETAKLGRYFIEKGAMLITADDGTKVLYYRK